MSEQPVIEVKGLKKHFPTGHKDKVVHAVNGIDFAIRPGETLGMVGESGSGKSTVGRTILRLTNPTAGKITFCGQDISGLTMDQCRPLRSDMQMVFQDPWSALNPRMKIGSLISEPLLLHDKMPRVCIARAIATNPKLIVLDEPTSSLDLSVRAGILELLAELKEETRVAMLFISHDLGTVKLISDRIVVLYLGQIVEQAEAGSVFDAPAHPYTQSLMSAHLPADPHFVVKRQILEGEVPSPIDLPTGCSFHTRCPVAIDKCSQQEPPLDLLGENGHLAACLRIKDGGNKIA